MSSDESNCTHISAASTQPDKNKETLKPHKPEEWEINFIGNFVLDLYHRSIVGFENEWLLKKSFVRSEYVKVLTEEIGKKLKQLNGTSDIGTLLHRCGFLTNTQRGSPFFKIKYAKLFEFRNAKLQEMDNLKINSDDIKRGEGSESKDNLMNLLSNKINISVEDNLEIDESVEKSILEYQASKMQLRKENYFPTNMSCSICQEDFTTMETYEDHIQLHGEETDFEFLNSMSKFDNPIFTLYCRLCKNSHYFCFEFESILDNLIIEKIIIVQSRSLYYVHNMRVPYKFPENGKDRFFVDSHLFTRHVEQPIVLICRLESSKETRIIEQHHFMRSEEFPVVKFSINPNRLPNKKLFRPVFTLADYFPPTEIRNALKDDFYHEKLMKTSNEFADYMRSEKTLQPATMGASFNILLQIEDMDTMLEYIKLTKQNIKLRRYGNEYSFQLKPKEHIFLENILSRYDEVVLTTRSDIINNKEDILNLMLQNKSDIRRKKNTFVGIIEAVNTGRISFKCDQSINVNITYTVICRPSRLGLRYQYRALELLPKNSDFLKNFLFPAKIVPRPLSTKSLQLYNPNISGEQLQAVRNIAEGPRNDATYIIFGPPGTGKTTTLVEAILQILKRPDTKILVTASSNSACDEIAVRLMKYLNELQLPRVMTRIYSRSCEVRSENIDDELLENSNMYNGHFYPDIEILHEYHIVIATLSVVAKLSTGKFGRPQNGCGTLYTHLFIDEVAASTEADALMAITTILTPKSCLIISGDNKQLGPILKSKRAKELGLDVSLMDRLLARDCYRVDVDTRDYDRTIQTRLVRNYRSHPAIVSLYSGLYYNHSLEAYAKMEDVSLCNVWHKARNKQFPIIFHAINEPSRMDRQSHSLYNMCELNVVMDYVKDLMYFGINGKPIKENDIGIISPYKKQYKRIQEELNLRKWFSIETGSVETFQGKEKDIIIVSFVRSGTSNLGFLDSPRRLNVTLSRPKSLLILIGNPQTLSLNSEFEYIIKECQRNNTFVGSIGRPKGNLQKQTTENLNKSKQNITTLNHKMQNLKVEAENQVKDNKTSKNKKRGGRRGGRGRARNNSRSRNKTIKSKDENEANNEDDYDDDDEEEEDNTVGVDTPSTSVKKLEGVELEDQKSKNTEATQKKSGQRRRSRGGKGNKTVTSGNNTKKESYDNDDDDDEEDNSGDDDEKDKGSTTVKNAKKSGRTGKTKQHLNNQIGAKSGKISKQYNKGKINNKITTEVQQQKLNKSKIESLYDELPQVPTTISESLITPTKTNVSYSKEQLLQLQQQQQFYQQQQQQLYQQQQQQFHQQQFHQQQFHQQQNIPSYVNLNNSNNYHMPPHINSYNIPFSALRQPNPTTAYAQPHSNMAQSQQQPRPLNALNLNKPLNYPITNMNLPNVPNNSNNSKIHETTPKTEKPKNDLKSKKPDKFTNPKERAAYYKALYKDKNSTITAANESSTNNLKPDNNSKKSNHKNCQANNSIDRNLISSTASSSKSSSNANASTTAYGGNSNASTTSYGGNSNASTTLYRGSSNAERNFITSAASSSNASSSNASTTYRSISNTRRNFSPSTFNYVPKVEKKKDNSCVIA